MEVCFVLAVVISNFLAKNSELRINDNPTHKVANYQTQLPQTIKKAAK